MITVFPSIHHQSRQKKKILHNFFLMLLLCCVYDKGKVEAIKNGGKEEDKFLYTFSDARGDVSLLLLLVLSFWY